MKYGKIIIDSVYMIVGGSLRRFRPRIFCSRTTRTAGRFPMTATMEDNTAIQDFVGPISVEFIESITTK
ncbi:MAG: hypothetical protein EGP82_04685 [Odoribacter splanchnicus]|nr:hypothetical protein [Odoribacter splanchnicus]